MGSDYVSDKDFVKALKKLVGTSIPQGSTQNTTSTMSAQGSGRYTTNQPSEISQIPIGNRYGFIRRIDLNPSNDFKYEVIFPATQTKVWARKVGSLGIKIPKGKIMGNYYYFDEQIPVTLSIDYQSFTWSIISEPDNTDFELIPDSVIIPYDDSIIVLHSDYVEIKKGNSKITITDDSISIDSKSVKINGEEFVGH
jgi:hypothetical protein